MPYMVFEDVYIVHPLAKRFSHPLVFRSEEVEEEISKMEGNKNRKTGDGSGDDLGFVETYQYVIWWIFYHAHRMLSYIVGEGMRIPYR